MRMAAQLPRKSLFNQAGPKASSPGCMNGWTPALDPSETNRFCGLIQNPFYGHAACFAGERAILRRVGTKFIEGQRKRQDRRRINVDIISPHRDAAEEGIMLLDRCANDTGQACGLLARGQ